MGIVREKASRKMIRNLILFIVLIILTFTLIFKDQDMGELYKIIISVDKKFLITGNFLIIKKTL